MPIRALSRAAARAAFVVAGVVLAGALCELFLAWMLRVPALSRFSRPVARHIYINNRNVLQFDPEFARYDPEVSYAFKPGRHRFRNSEFDIVLNVNTAGLRDDELSLARPEVIVLGDSFAMGWGVEDEETFAHLLEQRSGLKVLNAGISSFGTVREMRLLERLDTSRLKALVIQYCQNDLEETRAFAKRGAIPIMSRDEYEAWSASWRGRLAYYPGKYLCQALDFAASAPPGKPLHGASLQALGQWHAGLFLNTLVRSRRPRLDGVRVIVFEAGDRGTQRSSFFIAALRNEIRREGYPPWVRRLIAVDVFPVLSEARYFALDDHWNPAGHRAVAEALLPYLAHGVQSVR